MENDDSEYTEIELCLEEGSCLIMSGTEPEVYALIISEPAFFENIQIPDWWYRMPVEDEASKTMIVAYRLSGMNHDMAAYHLQEVMHLPEELVSLEDVTPREDAVQPM